MICWLICRYGMLFQARNSGVGKQALAGVGVTALVILAISAFAALVSMGGAPLLLPLIICKSIVLVLYLHN